MAETSESHIAWRTRYNLVCECHQNREQEDRDYLLMKTQKPQYASFPKYYFFYLKKCIKLLCRSLNNLNFLSLAYYCVKIKKKINWVQKVLFIFFVVFIGFPNNYCFYIYTSKVCGPYQILYTFCLCYFLLLQIWASFMLLVILTVLLCCFCVQTMS